MKKILLILICIPIGLVFIGGIAFTITQTQLMWLDHPYAKQQPDWEILGHEEIPAVRTFDADGDIRVTQVWIAVVDGHPYLRTSDTNWFANLQRDPQLELLIADYLYRCKVAVVADKELITSVHQAFRNKYPKRSKFFQAMGVSTNTVLALDCGTQAA